LFSFTLQIALLLACAGLACSAKAQDAPHLLLGVEDFTRLNELAKAQPWAAAAKANLLKEADSFPRSYEEMYGVHGVELPREGGAWYHLYVCPKSGTELVFRPPGQSVCPDTGQVMTGHPYDQIVYARRADSLSQAAVALALAYRLTQKLSYATEAAEILTKYAAAYLKYPIHDNEGRLSSGPKGARVYSQELDEAIWLIKMAWAYDLVRDSAALNADSRNAIENRLLRAGAQTVGRAPGSTYNIQAWVNGAVAAVGFTLNDKKLIAEAIDGTNGFREQMRDRVVDGFWIEGAWHYQFYALEPLERTAQMATRAGIPLWTQEPRLTALLASPVGLMFPNGKLPAFNDSVEDDLYKHRALYETAYSATGNPLFAAIAGHGGTRGGPTEAFLFGVPVLPETPMPAAHSQVFPEAGYAVLRSPDSGLMEIMKFGPHGGVHGHFDKLNELIYAKGELMGVDPGTQLYGAPTHASWDVKTVAHNTLTVDEQTQKPATGKLLFWVAKPEVTIASADAGDVYWQADLRRTIIMTADYVVEVSTAHSKDGLKHDIDWCYHNFGSEQLTFKMKPYSGFPSGNGYQLLEPSVTATLTSDVRFGFRMPDKKGLDLWMLASGETQAFAGVALGPKLRLRQPYFIARRHAKDVEFITLFEPVPDVPSIQSFSATESAITIRSAAWVDTITRGTEWSYTRKPLP
jgi:hypothetical protein